MWAFFIIVPLCCFIDFKKYNDFYSLLLTNWIQIIFVILIVSCSLPNIYYLIDEIGVKLHIGFGIWIFKIGKQVELIKWDRLEYAHFSESPFLRVVLLKDNIMLPLGKVFTNKYKAVRLLNKYIPQDKRSEELNEYLLNPKKFKIYY
jgi:hypothetical protein